MPGDVRGRVVPCGRWPDQDYENYRACKEGWYSVRYCEECAHLKRPDRNGKRTCEIKKRNVRGSSCYGDRECWNVFKKVEVEDG